jgi:hypothetical protein
LEERSLGADGGDASSPVSEKDAEDPLGFVLGDKRDGDLQTVHGLLDLAAEALQEAGEVIEQRRVVGDDVHGVSLLSAAMPPKRLRE